MEQQQTKALKNLLILNMLAMATCALLIVVDLGIKNDLMRLAKNVEVNLAAAKHYIRVLSETDSITDTVHSDISGSVPADTQDNDNARLEVENSPEEGTEISPGPAASANGRTRAANGRFQAKSSGV